MLSSGDVLKMEGPLQVNKQGSGLRAFTKPAPLPKQVGAGGSWLTGDPSRSLSELLKGQSWHVYLLVGNTLEHLQGESCIIREVAKDTR